MKMATVYGVYDENDKLVCHVTLGGVAKALVQLGIGEEYHAEKVLDYIDARKLVINHYKKLQDEGKFNKTSSDEELHVLIAEWSDDVFNWEIV